MPIPLWLNVFVNKIQLSTHPGTWYKSGVYPFAKSLHFSSAFWMIAFSVLDIRNKSVSVDGPSGMQVLIYWAYPNQSPLLDFGEPC